MLKLLAIGNLGKDASINTVNGKTVINFSVAHTEKWKDSAGTQQEKTTWVECAYWTDKTAVAAYLKKGQQVYAEGTPEVRTWEKDGKHGSSLSLRVGIIQLLDSKAEGSAPAAQQQDTQSAAATARLAVNATQPAPTFQNNNNSGDDLPF